MQLLQRMRIVEVPARTAPSGGHVNHRNQPLVKDVRIELVGVSVEVGDVEIRGCAKLGRSSQRRHAERQREEKVLHADVFVFKIQSQDAPTTHKSCTQLGNTQHAHNQAMAAATRLSTTPTRTMVDMRRRPLPNTIPALAAAVDAGFECVEVDVSRTKDGHLIALHSRELRHLTNGAKTSVADVTLREAMALEMPSGSYGVATFAEAMATVVNRGLRQITVDFKEDGRPGHAVSFAQTALAEIAMVDPDNGCPECVYWGKDDSVMLDVLREFPEARVGYTVANFSAAMRDGGLDNHADARARPIIDRAYCAAVQSEMASHKLRRECVRAGVSKVYAWTINDAAKVRRVANEGVDAIVTDEPGEATRQIRALRDGCPRPESTKSGRAAERHNRS